MMRRITIFADIYGEAKRRGLWPVLRELLSLFTRKRL
jgi:hypothetical protein